MAEAVIKTQLLPVDREKDIPQWGRVKTPATPTTPEQIEWTAARQADSSRYRETHIFEQEAVYEINIKMPTFPKPFQSSATGAELSPDDANGFPAERQANHSFLQLGQMPTYFRLTTTS